MSASSGPVHLNSACLVLGTPSQLDPESQPQGLSQDDCKAAEKQVLQLDADGGSVVLEPQGPQSQLLGDHLSPSDTSGRQRTFSALGLGHADLVNLTGPTDDTRRRVSPEFVHEVIDNGQVTYVEGKDVRCPVNGNFLGAAAAKLEIGARTPGKCFSFLHLLDVV
ncbi:hypothetical protein BDV28DRAFT_147008 [Aspergillus coremiiformis]|uniref:Uncharacterized protein n=1 Tax=Aspergillus coremiiformis TaxID=138285 RepID=A0A5N6ZA58_9EURO|nr:hypothetical protein BDV28DRAFT_147008 [Aspergillus coremiiformis]